MLFAVTDMITMADFVYCLYLRFKQGTYFCISIHEILWFLMEPWPHFYEFGELMYKGITHECCQVLCRGPLRSFTGASECKVKLHTVNTLGYHPPVNKLQFTLCFLQTCLLLIY